MLAGFAVGAALGAAVSGYAPKSPSPTFTQAYFKQLDVTNAALRLYSDTPCDSPDIKKVGNSLDKESLKLFKMEHSIPNDEDEIQQAHEVEAYLGFEVLMKDSVKDQDKCAKDKQDSNGDNVQAKN